MGIDFAAAMGRKDRIVARLSKGIESYLFKKNKITLFKGQGRLEGPKAVVVKGDAGETKVDTKNVLIATGSRPKSLPGMAPDGKQVLTSDEILQLKEIPKSLIVIGAGAVGMEFASMFARFGVAVTVIEMLPRILPLETRRCRTRRQCSARVAIHVGAHRGRAQDAERRRVGFRTAQGERRPPTRYWCSGPVTDGSLESTKIASTRQ